MMLDPDDFRGSNYTVFIWAEYIMLLCNCDKINTEINTMLSTNISRDKHHSEFKLFLPFSFILLYTNDDYFLNVRSTLPARFSLIWQAHWNIPAVIYQLVTTPRCVCIKPTMLQAHGKTRKNLPMVYLLFLFLYYYLIFPLV